MIRNFTPHTIVICSDDGTPIRELPSEGIARVDSMQEALSPIDGIPVVTTRWGRVTGLPEPTMGTWLIVSMPVLQALPNRNDLVRPDTGPQNVVRDTDGRIIGVKALTI
jgi:hypothetical protein